LGILQDLCWVRDEEGISKNTVCFLLELIQNHLYQLFHKTSISPQKNTADTSSGKPLGLRPHSSSLTIEKRQGKVKDAVRCGTSISKPHLDFSNFQAFLDSTFSFLNNKIDIEKDCKYLLDAKHKVYWLSDCG